MMLTLIPLPYRILALVLFAAALFGAGTVLGLHAGEAKLDAYRVAEQQQTIKAMAAAAANTRAMQAQKDEALHDAQDRAQRNADDASRATAAVRGMRDDLADARRRLSHASADAVRRYATAAQDVFQQCSEQYRSVAKDADGFASDSMTLQQAWPR